MIQILEINEVCKLLKVSRTTLSNLDIPTVKIGNRFKYLQSDIQEFIKNNKYSSDYQRIAAEQKIRDRRWMRNQVEKIKKQLTFKNGYTK